MVFAPKNIEKLYKEFLNAYQSARDIEPSDSSEGKRKLSLWPESMRDYLDRELQRHFEVKAFILDPAKLEEPEKGWLSLNLFLPTVSRSTGSHLTASSRLTSSVPRGDFQIPKLKMNHTAASRACPLNSVDILPNI